MKTKLTQYLLAALLGVALTTNLHAQFVPDGGTLSFTGPQAQILSPPRAAETDRKFYFADLPGQLQRVLRVQLRRPGDVSAVIETPGGFLLYVATQKTDKVLAAGCLSLPKRDYEQWLREQKVTPTR